MVYRGTVLPRHLGADNKADDGFIAQCIGEALPHVWQQTPLNLDWQQETGRGRQLFEMKLTWISPLKAGESFVIAVSLTGTQANMLGARFSCLKAAPAAFAPSPIPLLAPFARKAASQLACHREPRKPCHACGQTDQRRGSSPPDPFVPLRHAHQKPPTARFLFADPASNRRTGAWPAR